MKKIEAIIKPYLLTDIKCALQERGIIGMTVSEIKRYHFGTSLPAYQPRDLPFAADFDPCLKLEIVVENTCFDDVLDAVLGLGTLRSPSEEVTVQELEDVIRIRTREHGAGAI